MTELTAVTSSIPVLTGSIRVIAPSRSSESRHSESRHPEPRHPESQLSEFDANDVARPVAASPMSHERSVDTRAIDITRIADRAGAPSRRVASGVAATASAAHRLFDFAVTTRHSTLAAWRNAICVIFALAGVATAVWVARIPEVSAQLGIGSGGVAILLVGLSSGSITGLAVAPGLIGRLGARRMLTAAITGIGLGLTAIGVAVDVFAQTGFAFAALMLFGFSLSSASVTMNLEGTTVEKRVGRTILPMMHACYSAGTITGALVGALAASRGTGLLPYLALAAVFLLVAGLGTLRSVPGASAPQRIHFEAPDARGSSSAHAVQNGAGSAARLSEGSGESEASAGMRARLRARFGLLADRRLLLIGVMMVGMSFVEGSANDWLSLAAVEGHGLDHSAAALVYATFVSAMTLGRLVGGPLVDRLGTTRVLLSCATIASIGLATFIFGAGTPLIFVATALWGLGASLGFPVGMSLAADHPTDATRRVSMVSIFGYSASLAGPPALGMLAEHFGILHGFVLVLAFVVISLAVLPGTRKARDVSA